MTKSLPIFFFLLCFVQLSHAQFLWYENETNTYQIELESTTSGNFYTKITNPNNTGINTNAVVSKFNRDEGTSAFLKFDLYQPVMDFTGYTITIKAYLDIPTAALTNSNSKLRMYFLNASGGPQTYKQLNFSVGQTWESFTFDFNGVAIPEEILNANGFNQIRIGFANNSTSVAAATYYIDTISGTTEQVANTTTHSAAWLSGSWGVTFPVFGGERLDAEVAGGYNLPAGAQEVVDELPAAGHVITNLSYFAHSHYFTLRQNSNVDVATEIHESLVPSLANEAIIFEVMQKFKDSGKKVILYISTNYLDRADVETQAAWVDYYTNHIDFAGDEYLAYKDLVEGFIERVKDYADAYWLDTTGELYDDGHLEDFVEMIKVTDPGAAVSVTGVGAAYFQKNGENILVDSDGLDDEDARDYKIIKFEGVNRYQDFTRGHVTPLGQGAPPNSWAYEEFTIPHMVENPWSMYEGNTVLKHAWFPVRARWHVSSQPLVFGTEDAYRFAKRIVNANAGVTFATTINDIGSGKGYMMDDEMLIMKAINDRLLSNPVPDYEPYARPEGAFLVGESTLSTSAHNNTSQVKFYPNPAVNKLTITRTSTGIDYITVISILGTTALEKVWSNGSMTTQLDVSTLNSGIYFIKLSNGNNHTITQKIIISK
ncbi:T9SS type A sorting domain-containing protein [Mariniflexile sp. AS56]|uniref:T9SS type A sorting domain-containing protein n=1 Tax=Mariniflexile sp. AS56 TaxID=3063957 RepID=UPI0026F35F66|nr:T9SS type A sorting domain-containing protein [Mariniflexile sp. AS56]MDO7172426.1 T9SS type A sorting domain-containing protein [Mariniflexile sp. AS56]